MGVAGYVRAWIPFDEAVEDIRRDRGCGRDEARNGLLAALSDGAVASRFADTGERIAPEAWLPVLRGEAIAPERPPSVMALIEGWASLDDRPIECRRADIVRLWPKAGPYPASAGRAPSKTAAFKRWLVQKYPDGVPAGTVVKALARDFRAATGIGIADRTIRRALGGK